MSEAYHVPVLLEEVLAFLPVDPDGVYVDATLGGGGHAKALLERLGKRGVLLGVDRDREALEACRPLEAQGAGRLHLIHGNFGDLASLLQGQGWPAVDGILVDLGVSSRHLDEGERGFSFLRPGPLDMRMDASRGVTAAELVNGLSEEELAELFEEYGEEPRSRRVARAVVEARRRAPISTTADLARVVERALGRRGPKHPGTRVFQALRIAVNGELEALDALLAGAPGLLRPGGRLVAIAYHSLEDRRVKRAFRDTPELDVLTRKAVKANREEIRTNPRARSARLRAAQRISPGG